MAVRRSRPVRRPVAAGLDQRGRRAQARLHDHGRHRGLQRRRMEPGTLYGALSRLERRGWSGRWPPPDAAARTRPKLLGDGMSSTALTWAFASWVAKSSGYMLTSANVIIVSGRGRGFSVQKKRALISVLAGQDRDITQSYSNFGLGHRSRAGDPGRAGHHDAADRARRPAARRHGLGSVMWPGLAEAAVGCRADLDIM